MRSVFRKVQLGAVGAVTVLTGPPPAVAADALTVSAPGFPAGFVLDKLNARAAFLAGKAIGDGSLTASKSARELQLMIANTRVALGDTVDERWDKLAADPQALLRALDKKAAITPPDGGERGRIEDRVVLDVSAQLARPPFSDGVPQVRRIEGATQYFRNDGSYRLLIESNLPSAGATAYSLTVAGQPAPAEWLQVTPPNRMALTIPAKALATSFSERALVHVPIELSAVMPKGSWKFWQSNIRQVTFPFGLELFPRKPLGYVLKDFSAPTVVDDKRTLLVKGTPQTVAPCGRAGCVRDQVVCVDVPTGAKPVDTINYRDSMSGDPNGGWTGAVQATPTGFCAIFKQQSATVSRNVSFDVRYNPLAGDRQDTERKLRAARGKGSNDPPADADALEFGIPYSSELTPQMLGYELALKAFTGQTYSASSSAAPSSALLRVKTPERGVEPPRLTVTFQPPW
ncbi:MAG TPA: hypothetical protein VLK61_29475 [Aquabacterium sp.]|nr:hypothetical protein [Aquabacterium sp.]